MRDAPVAVSVVGAEEIQKSAVTDSYADLLRTVPGINTAQTSARDVNLTPRLATGRNARATLALLDGRTIYQDYFGMVLWDLLPINFDEVKQVEVVRGPDSAMWGANAMGGVVNILTKDPAEMLGVSGKILGGTLDTREASALYAGQSGAASYKVSGSYFTQDAWERPTTLPDGTPLPPYENTGTKQYRLDARLDLDRPEGAKWKFGAGFASSDGAMLTGLGPYDAENLYQGHAAAEYRKADFHASANVTLHDAKYVGFLSPDVVTMKNQAISAEAGDRHLFGEKNLVTWGATARYSHFDLSLVPDVHQRTDLGVFAEDEIFLAETLRLRIGARYDWSDTYGGALSPRTGLIFEPHKDHTFRLSWNRAFIAPSLVENFLYFPSSAMAPLPTGPYVFPILATGNEGLDAETMNAFEVGYTGTFAQRLTVTVSAYYNVSKDRIFFVPVEFYTSSAPPPGWPLPPSALDQIPLPKTFSYRNLGRIVDKGFEISADARLTKRAHGVRELLPAGRPRRERGGRGDDPREPALAPPDQRGAERDGRAVLRLPVRELHVLGLLGGRPAVRRDDGPLHALERGGRLDVLEERRRGGPRREPLGRARPAARLRRHPAAARHGRAAVPLLGRRRTRWCRSTSRSRSRWAPSTPTRRARSSRRAAATPSGGRSRRTSSSSASSRAGCPSISSCGTSASRRRTCGGTRTRSSPTRSSSPSS